MKKSFKKILAIALSLTLSVACFSSCGSADSQDDLKVAEGVPSFVEDKQMGILGYAMPCYIDGDDEFNKQSIRKIKDAGFTGMFIDSWSGPKMNTPEFAQLLQWFDEFGLDAYLSLNNGWQNRGNGTHAPSSSYDYSWKKLSSIKEDYSVYNCFKGINIFDEPGGVNGNSDDPSLNDFSFIESQYEYFKSMWDVNSENYIFSKGTYKDYCFFVNGCGDYNNVYKPLVERIYPMLESKKVSYDYYFMDYNVKTDTPFFQDMNLFHLGNYATTAKELNSPLWVYTETYSTQAGSNRGNKGLFNKEDIKFQNNLYMAFGCKCIEYFVYGSVDVYMGLTNKMGGETDTYQVVKQINSEIAAWDHIFLSFDWQGTIPVVGSNNTLGKSDNFNNFINGRFENHARISDLRATRDTLVGCFTDKDGFDGFYITNYSDPFYNRSDDVSVTFKKCSKVIECYNGETKEITLNNGEYNKSLNAGEAVFVIPIV